MPSAPHVRPLASALALAIAACGTANAPADPVRAGVADVPSAAALVAAGQAAGLARSTFPDPDPGIPMYARFLNQLNQVLHDGEWAAIRFNLLAGFDSPGPGGPGAFAAPLRIEGFFLVEADAPPGTFPRVAISSGRAVPVWFVRWPALRAAMSDNVVTIGELRALGPLEGTATRFEETLRPRVGEHLLVLNARGDLRDGRRFELHATHVEDRTRSIRIAFR